MSKWRIRDAKSRFSELIRCTAKDGPQIVTRRGTDIAVVMSIEEYRRLAGAQPSFKDHLLSGPKLDDEFVDLINERSRDMGRDIDFCSVDKIY